jgi:predicted dehydrogenase
MTNRKLRMGMIGGGGNAFIGPIHLKAALMEGEIELVCGSFSRSYETSLATGRSWRLPDSRIYADWKEMLHAEAMLPFGERMDFVAIVTPNHLHYPQAAMALEQGFDVVVDKPMTWSLDEALRLQALVERTGRTLALTHVYSAYPAVREMRSRIARGDLGRLRRVYVEYTQGWLSQRIELCGGNNAGWRTDPRTSGKGGCLGDIGTHAWHLCEYATGLKVTELCADLNTFVEGRLVDDDAAAFLRFEQGVKGILQATQIAIGEENDICLRVYGDRGGLTWRQLEPNTLYFRHGDHPTEELRIGNGYSWLSDETRARTRLPGGHPEGFIEAFANIYLNFALTVRARLEGVEPDPMWLDFPTVEDGVRGMQFVETMVASAKSSNKWTSWIFSEEQ